MTVEEVKYIAYSLAQKHLTFDEPIPDFSTRYPDRLESCLYTPFQKVYNQTLYPGLALKASVLLYLMIKNHPFVNGNKRLAITTLFVFLYDNKKWLKVDSQQLYNFTVWVASSPAELKDQVIPAIKKFIETYMQDL